MRLVTSVTALGLGPGDIVGLYRSDGLWNLVIRVETRNGAVYYKLYRDGIANPLFPQPAVRARDQATRAAVAHALAFREMSDGATLVPRVLLFDSVAGAFVMEAVAAPVPLLDYLTRGEVPDPVVSRLPRALARFHTARWQMAADAAFADTTFRDFKIALQYDEVARYISGPAGELLGQFAESYRAARDCITHGDLNSRNILLSETDTSAVGVIDFECAHVGTPAYDVAYLLAELFIAYENFGRPDRLRAAIVTFLDNYFAVFPYGDRVAVEREITLHLASQVLYRFIGPSRHTWTSHVEDTLRDRIMSLSVSLIEPLPRPASLLPVA